MQCRCRYLPERTLGQGTLYFAFDEAILMARFQNWFIQKGFAIDTDGGGFQAPVDRGEAVLGDLCRELKIPDREKEGVRILFLPKGANFGPCALKETRNLKSWCTLLGEHPLFNALKNEKLDIWFQPIVDAFTGKLYAHEALMRVVHQDGSITSPLELLQTAKESGTLFNLDRLARESALKAFAASGAEGGLFINFTPTAIYNPALCLQDTFGWAKTLGLDFSRIVFEVVESEKVEDFDHLDNILKAYREKGFKTALDDVGNDYDSLARLGKLGADIVKIDRAFVHNIAADPLRQELFKTLYTKAKTRGMEVLAEGVELEADYRFLRMLSVRLFQGYLFGKPAPQPVDRVTLPH
ncbi:MAG: EAL domain-containing protein [Campylobacterales bacterium]